MTRLPDLVAERDRKKQLYRQVFEEAKLPGSDEFDFRRVKCLGAACDDVSKVHMRVMGLDDEIRELNLQIEAQGGAKYMENENTILRPPFANPTSGGPHRGFLGGEGFKRFPSDRGDVYEFQAEAKMADVLAPKSRPGVSMDRWLAAAMVGEYCEDREALDFAKEQKSLSGGTTGVMVPEAFQPTWVDNLRANMVLNASGIRTVTMTDRTLTASRLLTDPVVGWRAETAGLSTGDPTFELQQLVAKSVAVRVQSSAEIAQDSPNFGSQLMGVMGRSLAQEIDRAGLLGTGQDNQPLGLVNTPNIGTSTGGALSDGYNHLVTGLQGLLEANVPLERAERNAIMSPRTWAFLESMQEADGQPLQRPNALQRMVFRPTTSVPNDLGGGNDESFIMLGDFSDLVMGVRMDAHVEAVKVSAYATNLMIDYIGWARVDFLTTRPASFHMVESITAGAS